MKSGWVRAGIGILFAAPLLATLGGPFLRHREGILAQYAIMARNHVRLGWSATRLGLYEVSAPDVGVYEDWRRYEYPNRPFLSVFATSLWFLAFGDGEPVIRLSLLVAALGTLVGFQALARRLLGDRWGTVAAAAFAFTPMFWYFSGVAVHLVYSLCFSMAAWACWVRRDERPLYRGLTYGFLALACLSDWPGFFAALSIAVDAAWSRRRVEAAALLGTAVSCFGLHLLHLVWIGSAGDPLIRRFLAAGGERVGLGWSGVPAFVAGEVREAGLYFTLGVLALAAVGLRRLPRAGWLLALLGLEEVVFMHWAQVHDFLSYSLVPFAAVAAARGAEALWTSSRAGRWTAGALLALAAAQAVWVMTDRLTRRGAYEVQRQAGLAIRSVADPRDRVLVTIADIRQYTPYYADRYTAGIEAGDPPRLMVHPSGGGTPVRGVEDLVPRLPDFTLVLVGDPDLAAAHLPLFGGRLPPESFGFLASDHPVRREIERRAIGRETRGAFVLYRLARLPGPGS